MAKSRLSLKRVDVGIVYWIQLRCDGDCFMANCWAQRVNVSRGGDTPLSIRRVLSSSGGFPSSRGGGMYIAGSV